MATEFFMPMVPPTVTHQEKQIRIVNGKPIVYEPDELKAARSKLIGHLGHRMPDLRYRGALRVVAKWCYPIPESCKDKYHDGQYKTTKPDVDNIQKLLLDCMTTVKFWKDDAIISSMLVEKFWARIPGIYIAIQELEVHHD